MNIDVKISVKPIDYIKSVNILEKRVIDVLQGKKDELLWILEHNPVYTAGTSSKIADLLDKNLDSREYICGDDYNISDIAIHSWYGTLVLNNAYNSAEFLDVESYKNLGRWAKQITERPAYKRGSLVNRKPNGPDDKSILERHDASDIKI